MTVSRRYLMIGLVAAALSFSGANTRSDDSSTPRDGSAAQRKPRIFFYHDGRHPLIYMYEPPMQKEEFEAGVDELVGTPIEAIAFCLGDGRTVLHDTKIGELWGHNVQKWPHAVFMRAHRNAKALIEAGHDPLQIICDRAHAKGKLLYATLLVQQGTGKRGQDSRASDFRFNNRHLEIGAKGGLDPNSRAFHCLDFMHQEVRDERFALIHETLNRYPVDGLELNLNYSSHYFHPDDIKQGRKIMTKWIARVYRAVKESGAERELAIRVPASVEGCDTVGLDIREWIRQGIVDVFIGQTLQGPELVHQMVDFRPLVAAAKGSNCRVLAAIHSHIDSDRLAEANVAMVRATACNYWAQGVDGLFLAHWFGNWPYDGSFYEKLRELPDPEIMSAKDKFYFLPTITGRYNKPVLEPGATMRLPVNLIPNKPVDLKVTISDDLPRWDKVGRVHKVLLRLRLMNLTELDRVNVRLNGKRIPDSQTRKINQTYRMSAPRYRTGSGYWFIYDLDRDLWPVTGENTLQINLSKRDDNLNQQVSVRDVELEIKYLMGKNFHRGEDPDLGPIKPSGI